VLDERVARAAKTLRADGSRLRLRPWAGETGTSLLILLTSGTAASDAAVAASIEWARAQGYLRIRTAALSHAEVAPFLRAGFEPRQQLALLCRPMPRQPPGDLDAALLRPPRPMPPPLSRPSGSLDIRRARRRHQPSVLAVDHAAFQPFWRLDPAGLREALRATPFRRFRVVCEHSGHRHSGQKGQALAGYSISGRSGQAGYLQRLATSPSHQGQGIGAALVIDGLRWMARGGATHAWVNTPHKNTAALRLYRRLGFELIPPGLQVLERQIIGP